MIDAFHATLKQTEIALNAIGMNVSPDVFLCAVAGRFVRLKLGSYGRIEPAFIGMQAGFLGDVLADDLRYLFLRSDLYMKRADLPATLHKGDDGALARRAVKAALGIGAAPAMF